MKALLVCAVSTKGQGQTVEQQEAALREAATRKGWTVVEVLEFHHSRFKEAGAAALESAVMKRVALGGVDVVCCWAMDRITRRGPEAALRFLSTLERHHGVGFFSLQEPFISTATADPAMRGLMVPLMAWLAELESQRKSDRQSAKAAYKRSQADKVGGRASWGKGRMLSAADHEALRGMLAEDPRPSQRVMAERLDTSQASVNRAIKALDA